MATWKFIGPKDYYVNTSAVWFLGYKSSGVPMLQHNPAAAADTNVIIQIPLGSEVDDGNTPQPYIESVTLHHLISATSAGVTPIISGNVAIWEVVHAAGKAYAGGAAPISANMAQLPNAGTSAGFVVAPSGTAWTPGTLSAQGIAVASLWTSSQMETFTNIQTKAAAGIVGGPAVQSQDYIPRLQNTFTWLQISASVGASAVWEHYGAIIKYK